MNVYYMISYDITDMNTYQQYPPQAIALIEKYGGSVMISDTEAKPIEGRAKNMHALVRFPSEEQALACYNDPEYQKIKKIRTGSTNNISMVLAKELVKQSDGEL